MKKYNYFHYGTPILGSQFLLAVPYNWKKNINMFGEYTYGGYRAVERD